MMLCQASGIIISGAEGGEENCSKIISEDEKNLWNKGRV